MTNLKRKVLRDVERWKQKRKREKREKFARIYDKRKTVEFKTGENLNMDKHFFMPTMTKDFNFGASRNAQIVYPVLCSRADFRQEKSFQMSRENIAKLAGISTVAVDDGLNVLENIHFNDHNTGIRTPLLHREMVQDGKRRYWTYLPGFFRPETEGLEIAKWRGNYFVFHTCIIDSGIWARLSRNAKALYLSIRSKAFFDQQAYDHIENIYIPSLDEIYNGRELYGSDGDPEKMEFINRKWDVCNRPLTELFSIAGIPYENIRELTGELETHGLVERLHETKSLWQVWLKPRRIKKNYS